MRIMIGQSRERQRLRAGESRLHLRGVSGPNKRIYLGLDLIRFLAALLVAFYHLAWWWWLPTPGTQDRPFFHAALYPVGHWLSAGWVGVPIFFTLSGFVISASASGKTATAFVRSRILRLYPAAWICTTITALVAFTGWPDYLRSMLLSPVGPWVSGVYWTLGAEIVFYFLVALMLAAVGSRWLAGLGIVIGSVSALAMIARLLDYATGGHFKGMFAFLDMPEASLSAPMPHWRP